MHIAPIRNYQISYAKTNNKQKTTQNNITFNGWKLDVSKAEANNMLDEVAKYFHKFTERSLKEVSIVRGFLGIKKSDASRSAYQKLSNAVEKVRKNKASYLSKIAPLAEKEAKQKQNITAEKLKVTEMFINMLDGGKVDNGILIHGTSKDKESFIDWLAKASGINFKEMEFNIQNPLKSLDEIIMYAKNAKQNKALTNKRTLLHVRNLDDLLANYETPEARRVLSKFKRFMDNSAEAYETTIVTSTNRLLEDFEDASIAPHRFGLKVALDEHITKSEKAELKNLRSKVKELDNKADRVDSVFYEEDVTISKSEIQQEIEAHWL